MTTTASRLGALERKLDASKGKGQQLVIALEMPDGSLEIDGELVKRDELEQWQKDNGVPASALILVIDLCMQPFQGQLDEEAAKREAGDDSPVPGTEPLPPAPEPQPEPQLPAPTPEQIEAKLEHLAREKILAEREAYIDAVLAEQERERIGYWDCLRIPGARQWERRRRRRR